MNYPCIKCGKEIRLRQQALECDVCKKWQHRTCDTGITQAQYRAAVKPKADISWTCVPYQMV